jgi:hypothetical protein
MLGWQIKTSNFQFHGSGFSIKGYNFFDVFHIQDHCCLIFGKKDSKCHSKTNLVRRLSILHNVPL